MVTQAHIDRLKADVKKRQEKEAFVRRMQAARRKAKLKSHAKVAGAKIYGAAKAGASGLAAWMEKQQKQSPKRRKRKSTPKPVYVMVQRPVKKKKAKKAAPKVRYIRVSAPPKKKKHKRRSSGGGDWDSGWPSLGSPL